MEIYQRMSNNKFFVFSELSDWFEEFRMYHRKDAKIVSLRDDLMSATRYAVMSLRFGMAGEDPQWTKDLEYGNYGIV